MYRRSTFGRAGDVCDCKSFPLVRYWVSAPAQKGGVYSTVYVKKLNNDSRMIKISFDLMFHGVYFFFFFFSSLAVKGKNQWEKGGVGQMWLGVIRMSRRPLLPFPQVGSAKELLNVDHGNGYG